MRTIFGYIRVSGKAQADKDGPVRQRLAIENFTQTALTADAQTLRFFEDLGVSGTIEGVDRPGFIDMVVESKPGDVIVVETLDRLARDLTVQELIIQELRERGLQLYAADQGLRELVSGPCDDDPARTMIRQIFGVIAQFAKSSLVLKLKAARQRKKRETGSCEGKKPYGKDKREQTILKLVKDLLDSGVGPRGMTALFNQQGVRKRNGESKWHPSEIENLINRIRINERISYFPYQWQSKVISRGGTIGARSRGATYSAGQTDQRGEPGRQAGQEEK